MWIIGIDPDSEASGLALRQEGQKQIHTLDCLDFWSLIDELARLKDQTKIVLIEAGWLNKSNWHASTGDGAKYAAEKGKNLGMNQQTGKLIAEYCIHNGIPYRLVKPAKTKNYVKDNARVFEMITGWKGRTNPEKRDAGMLVFSFIR